MYARHFFHLKQIQMRHTLLFGPIFVGAAIIALFLFLLNMTQPASEEQLKSAFLLVQIGILFLMIWCQILDLFCIFVQVRVRSQKVFTFAFSFGILPLLPYSYLLYFH